jgi:hypothetical protein
MTPEVLKFALKVSIVVAALLLGAWLLAAPEAQPPVQMGSIEGFTNYPSEYIPVQIVCAEPVSGGQEICTEAPAGDTEQLSPPWSLQVPPGEYYISSHLKDPEDIGSDLGDYRAYYTKYVTCGLRYECKDHTKIPIKVDEGMTVTGVAPYDWYIR